MTRFNHNVTVAVEAVSREIGTGAAFDFGFFLR